MRSSFTSLYEIIPFYLPHVNEKLKGLFQFSFIFPQDILKKTKDVDLRETVCNIFLSTLNIIFQGNNETRVHIADILKLNHQNCEANFTW